MEVRGVVHHGDIGRLGVAADELRRQRRLGALRHVGTWYVTAAAPADLVRLLQDGVRPTCLTACTYYGLWVPLHRGDHVYRPRGLGSGTAGITLVGHGSRERAWPDHDPVTALPLALDHAARCLPTRDAAILFESALNTGRLEPAAVRTIVAALPRRLARPFERLNPLAESGTETAVRWWLQSQGVHVTAQEQIPGVGRVDLKVGNSWVIECDGRRYHDTDQQFHRDRARDLTLRALGYTTTRLTWEQVFLDWAATRRPLLAILRRGDHRQQPIAA